MTRRVRIEAIKSRRIRAAYLKRQAKERGYSLVLSKK